MSETRAVTVVRVENGYVISNNSRSMIAKGNYDVAECIEKFFAKEATDAGQDNKED